MKMAKFVVQNNRAYPLIHIMADSETVKIDLEQVLAERLPKFYRYIPRRAVEWMKRLICQDRLNRLLEQNAGKEGAEFCRGILDSLDITVKVANPAQLPSRERRRVVIVSNHPLGGLDGMALIALVQRHYGGQVWFVVNDLLMAVKPLRPVFLPINKNGRQSRESIAKVDRAFQGDDPIIIFPAGLVSRLRRVPFGGERRKKMIHDLQWQKSFVVKAVKSGRDIVPVFFSGTNSMDFYRKANLRKRLGIKFNLEQILLPREIFHNQGATFTVFVGMSSPASAFDLSDAQGIARALSEEVYRLPAEIAEANQQQDPQ